jgi:5-methylthioadenosine/S-adenosylhomocysteine deaminase
MCIFCKAGMLRRHFGQQRSFGSALSSRRGFLAGAAATGAAAAGLNLFTSRPTTAQLAAQFGAQNAVPPPGTGLPGTRYVIKGGSVMTMDGGEYVQADVVVEGTKIVAVGPGAGDGVGGQVIDATGRIVIPGFIDTHHHQFETSLRSFLADGVLINDGDSAPGPNGSPGEGNYAYYEQVLLGFAPIYRPQDVYINELFGALSQLDDGVTTVHDVSQIHHTPAHSDAAVQALFDSGKRAAFGYFEGAGEAVANLTAAQGGPQALFGVVTTPGYAYPNDAFRLYNKWFNGQSPGPTTVTGSGSSQTFSGNLGKISPAYTKLVTMIMGGEVYLSDAVTQASWTIGRQLGLQVAAHILSPFDIRPSFDLLAQGIGGSTNGKNGGPGTTGIGPDNLFIHTTGMSDLAWTKIQNQNQTYGGIGPQVSLAVPIEMNMRHGMPPMLKLQNLGLEPSLSVDVECTLTADFFTQMRAAMNEQRAIVNQMTLDSGTGLPATAGLPNSLDWGLPENYPNSLDQQPIFTAGAQPGWPPYPNGAIPAPLTTRDALRFATINGAKALRLDDRTGSLTVGKEADIIILDATRINVAPLNNVPGAVVSLMDRTNVETVIVAGKIRKWKGQLLDNFTGAPLDLAPLRAQLDTSRDYIFAHAFNNAAANGIGAVTGVPQNLFGGQ